MTQKIVIVGAGIAGVSAAQFARDTDPEADITLVCGEEDMPYYRSRTLALLSGGSEEKLALRPAQWYEDMKIRVVQDHATYVSLQSRQVCCADGLFIPYDKLILTTGASVPEPDFPGAELPEVVPLRHLSHIRKAATLPGPIAVLGAGPLAVEAAWQLSSGGKEVILVGNGKRILQPHYDRTATRFLLRMLENADIKVALKAGPELFDGNRLILKDGRAFPCRSILCANGIRPNTKLGQHANLELYHGILVDERMQTSNEDIFAAGDCAEVGGRIFGRWTSSAAQGKVAGINAAGGDAVYDGALPAISLHAGGVDLWQKGDVTSEEYAEFVDPLEQTFAKFFFCEGRLVGAEMIGRGLQDTRVDRAIENQMSEEDARKLLAELFPKK